MNNWAPLKQLTQARIGLPRAGATIATRELLELQLAHARARDAVWRPWDHQACARSLEQAGLQTVQVHSQVADRTTYLKRPDLGRRLDLDSLRTLSSIRRDPAPEVALTLSDGLSASAVGAHGVATVCALHAALAAASLTCSPIVLAPHGRVALSDEIGYALGTRVSVIVLGERPGLSSADSLGIYLTCTPLQGNTDAQRNCISNVREPGGLPPAIAATRLVNLLRRALVLGRSGVDLKDDANVLP